MRVGESICESSPPSVDASNRLIDTTVQAVLADLKIKICICTFIE